MKSVTTPLAALLCAPILSIALTAQTAAPAGQLRSVTRVAVKHGRVPEFLEIERQMTELYKKNSPSWRSVWRNLTGNNNEFTFIYPVANYAELDGPPEWWSKMPAAQMASLQARRQDCIERTVRTIEITMPQLVVADDKAPLPAMVRTTRTRVRPGMADQYIAAIKEAADAVRKAGLTGMRVRRLTFGGSRSEFVTSFALNKWADIDGETMLSKAMGGREAVAKWQAKVAPLVAWSEYNVSRQVTDLSYDNRPK